MCIYNIIRQFCSTSLTSHSIGVFWGAFDPPTKAHIKIIEVALTTLKIEKLVIVVNNHNYKKYSNTLAERIDLLKLKINKDHLSKIIFLTQDDQNFIDYNKLKVDFCSKITVIAGADSFRKIPENKIPIYDAIAVVPRASAPDPINCLKNVTLLPIGDEFKYVSSSNLKLLQEIISFH